MNAERPRAVLFVCAMNAVRSPIAAALFAQQFGKAIKVASAGVHKGELDPFAVAVMDEIGLDITRHKPISIAEKQDLEGLDYDLVVTLSPDAHHVALDAVRGSGAAVEYWPTPDPTAGEGSREQRLFAYRAVRDQLMARIRQRFASGAAGNE